MEQNFFYVYLHADNEGNIFYVGKGCKRRAKSISSRSKEWQEKAKNGFSIIYAAKNLSETQAYNLEKKLIAELLPTCHLVNIYSGGGPEGITLIKAGIKHSEEHKKKLAEANKNYKPERYDKSSKTLAIGLYVTPKGTFHSLRLAAVANQCAIMTVKNRCLGFTAKRGTKTYPVAPKNGWSFTKNDDKVTETGEKHGNV